MFYDFRVYFLEYVIAGNGIYLFVRSGALISLIANSARAMIALGWMKRNHYCNSASLQMAGLWIPQIASFCSCDLSL